MQIKETETCLYNKIILDNDNTLISEEETEKNKNYPLSYSLVLIMTLHTMQNKYNMKKTKQKYN